MAKLIEDIFLILDMAFIIIAAIFKIMDMEGYSKLCYSFSEAFLIVALIAMIVERTKKIKNNKKNNKL